MIVFVDISCWQGYSIGATHYHVKIKGEGAGSDVYRSKFDTYGQATTYAREIIDAHFTGHEIESTGETRFVYDRDGD